jgi:Protein of unknown function (DUF3775)
MLRVSPETVCAIIAAAREMQAMADGDIDDVALDDDEETEFLADAVKETGRDALLAELAGLGEEESLDLIALMLVGRASYGRGDWHEARGRARDLPFKDRARYLADMPLLGIYLERGLEAFGLFLRRRRQRPVLATRPAAYSA